MPGMYALLRGMSIHHKEFRSFKSPQANSHTEHCFVFNFMPQRRKAKVSKLKYVLCVSFTDNVEKPSV